MANEICNEYRASRNRKAAYFLMRLCISYDTVRQIYLALSIGHEKAKINYTLYGDSYLPDLDIEEIEDAFSLFIHTIYRGGMHYRL